MLAGGAHFADGFKYLLQQRELVRRKGVAGDKFGSVFVAAQADGIADKAELVVDDVALAGKGTGLLHGSRFQWKVCCAEDQAGLATPVWWSPCSSCQK
ncbi:MAG: hypothetical protein ACYC03_01580, partial [Acidovorax defluvii]